MQDKKMIEDKVVAHSMKVEPELPADFSDPEALAQTILDGATGDANVALLALRAHAENIRTGKEKADIYASYLVEIKSGVNSLLALNGFDSEAVPADYTQQPPASIESVRRNYIICCDVLEESKDSPVCFFIHSFPLLCGDITITTFYAHRALKSFSSPSQTRPITA